VYYCCCGVEDEAFETDSEDEHGVEEVTGDEEIDDGFDPASETVFDRLAALKDIVRPTLRYKIQKRSAIMVNASVHTSKIVGNIAWILATTAVITVFPLIMCSEKEAGYMAWENEQRMAQQGQQVRDLF
jgi:import receptor subunit TOM22